MDGSTDAFSLYLSLFKVEKPKDASKESTTLRFFDDHQEKTKKSPSINRSLPRRKNRLHNNPPLQSPPSPPTFPLRPSQPWTSIFLRLEMNIKRTWCIKQQQDTASSTCRTIMWTRNSCSTSLRRSSPCPWTRR